MSRKNYRTLYEKLQIVSLIMIAVGYLFFHIDSKYYTINTNKYIYPEKEKIPSEFNIETPQVGGSQQYDLVFYAEDDFRLSEFTYIYDTPILLLSGRTFYPTPIPVTVADSKSIRNFNQYSDSKILLSPPSLNTLNANSIIKTALYELKNIEHSTDSYIFMLQWAWYIGEERFKGLIDKFLYIKNRTGCAIADNQCVIRAIKVNFDGYVSEIALYNDAILERGENGYYHFKESSLNPLTEHLDIEETLSSVQNELENTKFRIIQSESSDYIPVFDKEYIENRKNRGRYLISIVFIPTGLVFLAVSFIIPYYKRRRSRNEI